MSLVSVTASDGKKYSFDYSKMPFSGRMKDVWLCTDGANVIAFFKKPLESRDFSRLVKIIDVYRASMFRGNADYYGKLFSLPFAYGKTTLPRSPFPQHYVILPKYPACFMFSRGQKPGSVVKIQGKEKKGRWFASAKLRRRYLHPDELGSWETSVRCCLEMCRAVDKMHRAGVAHSDLSYNNVLIDPVSGAACVIDCDSLVVEGMFPAGVAGTPDFIAPEVYRTMREPDSRRVKPNQKTDLHALAVLIYQYLLYRHPLRGRLSGKLAPNDAGVDEALLMGEKALFVEHATDKRNQIDASLPDNADYLPYCDTARLPVESTGPVLTELFRRAFEQGLQDPSKRPTANEWVRALEVTLGMIVPCQNPHCHHRAYVYHPRQIACPFCGAYYRLPMPKGVPVVTEAPRPQYLAYVQFYSPVRNGDMVGYEVEPASLVLRNPTTLHGWHEQKIGFENMSLGPEQRAPKAKFVWAENGWRLENMGFDKMVRRVKTADKEEHVPIPTGSSLALEPGMQIQFAPEGRLMLLQVHTG